MRKNQLAVLSALFFLNIVACTKEKRDASGTALISGSGSPTLSGIQNDIMKLSCAVSGCHDNRANPAGSLDLSSYQASYAGLVNRRSTQAPSLFLVKPGDVNASYLLLKLQNLHSTAGGSGDRMPLYAAALLPGELDRFITWVTDGAQLN